jgi:hypothetical protein
MVLLGLAGGTVGALFLVRLMKEVLYGISPTDPLTFIAVTLLLLSVAVIACAIPARLPRRLTRLLRYAQINDRHLTSPNPNPQL